MTKTLGQAVVVENRPGAGANLGAGLAARSTPDGYAMLMTASSLHGINPFLFSKLGYDPNQDLAPVITSPEQMASMIQDEVRRWGPIVKASGTRID
jgi:tripartite-type tricarboxylate transporter receptor subunit TctC